MMPMKNLDISVLVSYWVELPALLTLIVWHSVDIDSVGDGYFCVGA